MNKWSKLFLIGFLFAAYSNSNFSQTETTQKETKKLLTLNTLLPTATDLLGGTDNVTLIKHNGASVLPIVMGNNGVTYAVLGEETRGYWDDFCGKSDPGEDSITTAAREFCEEMLIEEILGKTPTDMVEYLKLKNNNTQRIIYYGNTHTNESYFTTYITLISEDSFLKVFDLFPKEIRNPKLPRCKTEKVRLGLVYLDDLLKVIAAAKNYDQVFINVFVGTKKGDLKLKKVWLRPFLVQKLKPYAKKMKPTMALDNEKILFYSQDQQNKINSFMSNIKNISNIFSGLGKFK